MTDATYSGIGRELESSNTLARLGRENAAMVRLAAIGWGLALLGWVLAAVIWRMG